MTGPSPTGDQVPKRKATMNRKQSGAGYLPPKTRVFNVLTEKCFCDSVKDTTIEGWDEVDLSNL